MIKQIFKKTYKLLISISILLLIVYSDLIVFIPLDIRDKIHQAKQLLLGNVNQIKSMFIVDRITFLQIIIICMIMLAAKRAMVILLEFYKEYAFEKGKMAGYTIARLVMDAVNLVVVFMGALWILYIIGIPITTLFTGTSIIVAAVSMCQEQLISDVFTGCLLLFDNEIKVRDYIEVNGTKGVIAEIGIRTTKIKEDSGNIIVINNSNMRNIKKCFIQKKQNDTNKVRLRFYVSKNFDSRKWQKSLETIFSKESSTWNNYFENVPMISKPFVDKSGKYVMEISADTKEKNLDEVQNELKVLWSKILEFEKTMK